MSDEEAARLAGPLSLAYLMAIITEVMRASPVDFLDLLLITMIATANLLPAAQLAGRRSARVTRPPIPGRAGISRNAVSRALNMPLETVRRRVAGLIEKGVLSEQSDGLVFRPDNELGLGNNSALQRFNLERLRDLFRTLKASGVSLD